ncbi:PREDICTED: heterogeneous nuclear ribonucleoprotein 1-like [Camelina sativa]|uniref:Heterogeneous nuclear ribonucleoprotein 1-like n=1 Tax=Camelina sativa TaxID=90675 RepID=A0ABM0YAI0_CAMSA|nr:PREDICTED: heterogeneous nuclear ribonucleoprotein 1-like [Camelina sativa]XP_010498137.1 PREDICTED: heterogeneous nuclear ribonucleoprotein 1-like [Camelina sativa]
MDYNSDRGYDDSYHRHLHKEQLPPSDYEVETFVDRSNGGAAVDTGGVQMKHAVENRHSSSSMSSPGKLFVGGVSWETTEETFVNYFGKFGEVVDSVFMTDRMTGNPRGFGFVTFADSAVAEKVLEEEHVLDDRKVELKRTVPRGDRDTDIKAVSKTRKIFVGGLPPLLEEDELKNYFCVYGDIIEHQIMYDHLTGRSRGFGFITFQTEDSVDRLFSDGKVHELGDKQVEIRRAEPKRTGRDNSFRSYGASGKYDQEDCYGGKGNEDYNMYSGYGSYGGYGAYAGNSMVNAAGFYGYGGGYGYGYGYGGQMFNLLYGAGGYMGGGYGVAAATAYGGGKAHGNGNSGSSSGRGNGTNGSGPARYHPYQK